MHDLIFAENETKRGEKWIGKERRNLLLNVKGGCA
jgi:hypothetical protein